MQTYTHESTGDYGMARTRTLAIDEATGLGVLVEDEFTGRSQLEGGMMRPHLYTLDAATADAAKAAWDDEPDPSRSYTRAWQLFWHDHAETLAQSGGRRYYGKIEHALTRHVTRQGQAA